MTKAFVKIGTNFIKVPTHPVIYTFYKSTSQKDHVNAFIGNNFALLRSPMIWHQTTDLNIPSSNSQRTFVSLHGQAF